VVIVVLAVHTQIPFILLPDEMNFASCLLDDLSGKMSVDKK
jgi:hypothetical protein